jgi:hypothetical protein
MIAVDGSEHQLANQLPPLRWRPAPYNGLYQRGNVRELRDSD